MREPVRGRRIEAGDRRAAPPCSGRCSVCKFLNVLGGVDIKEMDTGTPETIHLNDSISMKIAAADRRRATAIRLCRRPVGALLRKSYANLRRREISLEKGKYVGPRFLIK